MADESRPEFVSVWRRRTDVSELRSTAGIAGTGGCAACAFRAGCKNGTLFATLNDSILGGVFNVACPSSCIPVRQFIHSKKKHTRARHQSKTIAGVRQSGPIGPTYVKPSSCSFL